MGCLIYRSNVETKSIHDSKLKSLDIKLSLLINQFDFERPLAKRCEDQTELVSRTRIIVRASCAVGFQPASLKFEIL